MAAKAASGGPTRAPVEAPARARSEAMAAAQTARASLANSDGCTRKMPSPIQRVEP